VRFGVFYGGAGPWATAAGARELAVLAEDLGYDSVWAVDHAVLPVGFAERYRSAGGGWDIPDDYPMMDPLVWLTFVAAHSSRLTLATGVLLATLRNPVQLAKQVASLDVLSEGRLVLGLGAGWLDEELRACGVDPDERFARLEESVAVMRALWSGAPDASFAGRFTRFERLVSRPRPFRGDVPVVLGGRTPLAARRAGRLGCGFFPHTRDPDQLETLFGVAREAAAVAGHDPDAMRLVAGGATSQADVARLAEAGVAEVVFSPRARDVAELRESLESYRRRVIGAAVP
jgi:probable F420-dependent oxidoreductase